VEHHSIAHTDDKEPVVSGYETAEPLLQQHGGSVAHGRHGDDLEGVRRSQCQAEQLPVPGNVGACGGNGIGRQT
jgi:hypothetical protein